MRDPEAAIASAFYDHEQELARDREHRADDWGADSVFATHPRRRFSRRGAVETPVRRHAGTPRAPQFDRRPSGPVPAPVDARAEDASEALPPSTALSAGIEWTEPVAAADPAPEIHPAVDVPEPEASHSAAVEDSAGTEAPEPGGRRTVVVTGRPGGPASPSLRPLPADRRRPRARAVDRYGARPDRVAGWAFGLGMLLILVAVATADAAPL